MGILQGRLQILMAHPFLHGPGINPLHQGMRTKSMAQLVQLVQLDAIFDPGSFRCIAEGLADIVIMAGRPR